MFGNDGDQRVAASSLAASMDNLYEPGVATILEVIPTSFRSQALYAGLSQALHPTSRRFRMRRGRGPKGR